MASLMVALDTLVVSTALTTIRQDLGASIDELEWTVNSCNLSLAVLLLPAAALGDRFGRRGIFAAGLALFAATSGACALALGVGWLIAARAVQAAGAALVISIALAIVSAAPARAPRRRDRDPRWHHRPRRGRRAGIGGALSQGLSWEWIFWVNVPIGLVALPLALTRIDETFGSDTGLDVRGLALVGGGALGIVWGLVRGNAAGWDSLEVTVALGVGAALVAAGLSLAGAVTALALPARARVRADARAPAGPEQLSSR